MREQVVARDQQPAVAVVEERVARAVAGPVMDVEHAVTEAHLVPVAQHARDLGGRSPGAVRPRDGAQCAGHVRRDAVAQHHVVGEVVVRLRLAGVVLDERHRDVEGRDVRPGVTCDERHEAEVVDVLVGEDHELDVLEPVPELGDPTLQDVE